MKIDVLTLFPEMFAPFTASSADLVSTGLDAAERAGNCPLLFGMTGRAAEAGVLEINAVDIRAFTEDKHGRCDDYVFGGGDGMLMTPQPVVSALRAIDPERRARRVYMSPKGVLLTADKAREFAECGNLVILCGRYEGVDERVVNGHFDEEISIGDYILTGGELPAMVLIDCVSRFVPGVLGNENSAVNETFSDNLLEYPQYTRPRVFAGDAVPDVLLSGNHADIREWRRKRQIELTRARRPDLYKKYLAAEKKSGRRTRVPVDAQSTDGAVKRKPAVKRAVKDAGTGKGGKGAAGGGKE